MDQGGAFTSVRSHAHDCVSRRHETVGNTCAIQILRLLVPASVYFGKVQRAYGVTLKLRAKLPALLPTMLQLHVLVLFVFSMCFYKERCFLLCFSHQLVCCVIRGTYGPVLWSLHLHKYGKCSEVFSSRLQSPSKMLEHFYLYIVL